MLHTNTIQFWRQIEYDILAVFWNFCEIKCNKFIKFWCVPVKETSNNFNDANKSIIKTSFLKNRLSLVTFDDSAKLGATGAIVPYVSCAWRTHLADVPRAWRASCLKCSSCLTCLMPYVLRVSRALYFTCSCASRVSRTLIPHVSLALGFLLLIVLRGVRVLLLLSPLLFQVFQA